MSCEASSTPIGYLIPEFPGQTHIFFWREIQELRQLGVQPDLVSTRPPDQRIQSHEWSRQAVAQTTYLFPPTVGACWEAWSNCSAAGLRVGGGPGRRCAELVCSACRETWRWQ